MTEDGHFRRSARPHVTCKVTLYKESSESECPIDAYTRDIGTGGLFAVTDGDFQLGEHLELHLSAPSAWEPLVLNAEICRIEESCDNGSSGVGLRFIDCTDAQLLALAQLIESLDYES